MEKKTTTPALMMLGSMLIFGTIGIFRRYIPLPSAMLACVRGLLGGSFLLLVVLAKGKGFHWNLTKKQFLLLCVTGVALGLNWMLLFEAFNYTSIAVATLCYYMEPTTVILLSPLLFKEKLSAKKLVCVVISVIGIALVSGIADIEGITSADLKGILFGLAAAALYSTVVIMNKKNPVDDAYGKTIVQLFAAAVVLLPYILLTADFGSISLDGRAWVMILIVGIVHTGVAYALYFGCMHQLKSQTVAVMSYLDPVSAIFLSAIFLNEPLTLLVAVGAFMVLGAALFSELGPLKKRY
ncbi:MAG: DMT family transporter [Lachnospiraceae bacterium]|nr:DMT family transporter [Lachnospiraceae bacterium]